MNRDMSFADATGNACLSSGIYMITNDSMACNSDLSSKHAPLPYLSGTGNAYLGRHNSVVTNFYIMSYLYKVIEFDSFSYKCSPHSRSVYACVGSYFYIVFNCDNTDLRYFFVSTPAFAISSAVGIKYSFTGVISSA